MQEAQSKAGTDRILNKKKKKKRPAVERKGAKSEGETWHRGKEWKSIRSKKKKNEQEKGPRGEGAPQSTDAIRGPREEKKGRATTATKKAEQKNANSEWDAPSENHRPWERPYPTSRRVPVSQWLSTA